MAEYIDRKAIIEKLNEIRRCDAADEWDKVWDMAIDTAVKAVEKLPAADVAPVKRGFWKPISESEMTGFNPEFAGRDPIAGYKCSNCGNEAILSCNDDFVLADNCPNCGAEMNGDGGDG